MLQRIKFKNVDYVLVNGGAIATEEQYTSGEISFAHLGSDGKVRRFHEVIGMIDDIEFGDEVDLELSVKAFERLLQRVVGILEKVEE